MNAFHRWVERGLLITFLIMLWFVKTEYTFSVVLLFLFILFCVRAFMEWKYERTKKEYIITLHDLVTLGVAGLIFKMLVI